MARAGVVPPRLQSGVAISADGESWFLINASPDLGAQLNAFPALHPRPPEMRQSRIAGVLLTNGDLDHVLGLLLLREGPVLQVYATAAVREALCAGGIDAILAAFCGVVFHEPANEWREIRSASGRPSRLLARAIPLPGSPPPFVRRTGYAAGHSIAWHIEDRQTGARLLVAPDVSAITPVLEEALPASDIVLFDGTFWSSGELRQVRDGARLAEEMGHLPISTGSLPVLRSLPLRHKVYFHINNTNPILIPGSPERAEAEAAGMIIGYDGLEFEL